jgi:hypothetical protein
MQSDNDRSLLRHTVATLSYQAGKALRDPPPGFAHHRIGAATRTPLEIVGHLGDLIEWAASLADGQWTWKASSIGEWDGDVVRFYAAMTRLDARLASDAPLGHPAPIIFQGPIADAFTHVGQVAMLRGHAGAAVRPESFAKAEITPGRVGPDQSLNRREFEGDASKKC